MIETAYEVGCGLFCGFDWSRWTTGTPQERPGVLPRAQEHILQLENGKDRYLGAVCELSHSFALAVPHPEVLRIRDDAAFFQAVQAVLGKHVRPQEELDHAVRQIFSRPVAAVGITSDGLRREALRRKGVIPDDAIEFGVVARRLHFEPNWTLGSRSRQ